MKYKAVLSDVDDTLLVSDLTALPTKEIKEAVKKTKEKGIIFSLVSARPLRLLEPILAYLEITDPVVLDNGARVYNPATKEVLWESVITTEKARAVLSLAKKYGAKAGVGSGMDSFPDLQEVTEDMRIRKFNIKNLTEQKAKELMKEIKQVSEELYIVPVPSNDEKMLVNVQVTNADATKQYGVLKFAEIVGIDTKEIIGIGDHYNDFPFLMSCGFKVAMGNALPDLKEIADYIAPTVEENGVADVIEKFILHPEQ